MMDNRDKYYKAMSSLLVSITIHEETGIESLQQQLYDIYRLRRNLDWLEEEVTEMLSHINSNLDQKD